MGEFLNKINWGLLQKQKQWLIAQNCEASDGLLTLIDSVQDYAVADGGFDESAVFGVIDDAHINSKELKKVANVLDAYCRKLEENQHTFIACVDMVGHDSEYIDICIIEHLHDDIREERTAKLSRQAMIGETDINTIMNKIEDN